MSALGNTCRPATLGGRSPVVLAQKVAAFPNAFWVCHVRSRILIAPEKKAKSGTTPYPNKVWASATRAGRNGGGQGPGNTRHRRQRESRQRATHEPQSEHTPARRHSVVCHRSSNQENKGGNYGAYSIRRGAGTACRKEKGSRSQGMQCARTKSASTEST
jgi:hypothetical protein